MKLLLPIEIHVAVCELKATQRRTDPLSQVDSYRNASFKYRCYVVCGTTALHRQASTPVQQLFFQTVFKIIHNNCSSNIGVSCCVQIQLEGTSVGNLFLIEKEKDAGRPFPFQNTFSFFRQSCLFTFFLSGFRRD